MKRRKGSVIVIAMLIVSAVGAIAFSFSRVLLLEIASARAYENGIGAFYAAESGLEEGFLRLRFSKDLELPGDGANQVIRANISTSKSSGQSISKKSNEMIEPKDQLFDLNISSEVPIFGEDKDKDGSINPVADMESYKSTADSNADFVIMRDESKKFSLKNLEEGGDLNFWFKPLTSFADLPAPLDEKRCVLLETKIVGKLVGSKTTQEKKIMFYSNDQSCNYSSILKGEKKDSSSKSYILPLNNVAKISNIKNQIWPTVKIVDAYLFVKPIGSDIAIAFENNQPVNRPMYGANVIVESTGYYGGIARSLSASIDRQSGTLYDLFDYVIYEAN